MQDKDIAINIDELIDTLNEFKFLREKNTPKKPISSDVEEYDALECGYVCPNCHGCVLTSEYSLDYILENEPVPAYCEHCGQALKWKD